MKYFLCALTLFLSFSVQAAILDTNLGNVIAVQRELSDIYAACTAKITNSIGDVTKPSRYFVCNFSIITDNEISQAKKAFLRNPKNDSCTGEGNLENGQINILFGVTDKISNVDESKACLAKLLTGKNTIKTIVHTIQ